MKDKNVIGSISIFINNLNEDGEVLRNKARPIPLKQVSLLVSEQIVLQRNT